MKVILTGGCTGGHIYPALAIGDKFREKDPDNDVIYVAHARGMETEIVPRAGYDLKIVRAEWLNRKDPIKLVRTLYGTMQGRRQAYRIMKEFRPDAVVSTGSFVSVPVVLAAAKYGAPIFIHEQNAFPGVSNRTMSRFAEKVFLGFDKGREYFPQPEKLMYSGNPVRAEFYGRNKAEDRAELGIDGNDLVVLTFGGSLGAPTINAIGEEIVRQYGGTKGITILFGTGKDYYEGTAEKLAASGLGNFDNVKLLPYINNMAQMLSAADIVISRAGALSVAEITMSGRAAIFVPSPNVTADHQYHNAKAVADNGGAVIVRENENTVSEVMTKMKEMVGNRDLVRRMGEASFAIAPTEAAEIIYNEIMRTCKGQD